MNKFQESGMLSYFISRYISLVAREYRIYYGKKYPTAKHSELSLSEKIAHDMVLRFLQNKKLKITIDTWVNESDTESKQYNSNSSISNLLKTVYHFDLMQVLLSTHFEYLKEHGDNNQPRVVSLVIQPKQVSNERKSSFKEKVIQKNKDVKPFFIPKKIRFSPYVLTEPTKTNKEQTTQSKAKKKLQKKKNKFSKKLIIPHKLNLDQKIINLSPNESQIQQIELTFSDDNSSNSYEEENSRLKKQKRKNSKTKNIDSKIEEDKNSFQENEKTNNKAIEENIEDEDNSYNMQDDEQFTSFAKSNDEIGEKNNQNIDPKQIESSGRIYQITSFSNHLLDSTSTNKNEISSAVGVIKPKKNKDGTLDFIPYSQDKFKYKSENILYNKNKFTNNNFAVPKLDLTNLTSKVSKTKTLGKFPKKESKSDSILIQINETNEEQENNKITLKNQGPLEQKDNQTNKNSKETSMNSDTERNELSNQNSESMSKKGSNRLKKRNLSHKSNKPSHRNKQEVPSDNNNIQHNEKQSSGNKIFSVNDSDDNTTRTLYVSVLEGKFQLFEQPISCVLSIYGQQKSTDMIKSNNPKWNDNFAFNIENNLSFLKISIVTKNMVFKKATIPISMSTNMDFWLNFDEKNSIHLSLQS